MNNNILKSLPVKANLDNKVPYASYPSADNITLTDVQYAERMAHVNAINMGAVQEKKSLGNHILLGVCGLLVVGTLAILAVIYTQESEKRKTEEKKGEEQRKTNAAKADDQKEVNAAKEAAKQETAIVRAGLHDNNKNPTIPTSTSGEEAVMTGVSFPDIKEMAIPDIQDLRLCGEIYAGDICVLTGATNIGKSIVAMQIAIEIASSRPSSLFPYFPVCNLPNDVFIFDAEQRLSQLKNRYFSNDKVVYPSNLKRFPEKDEVITNLDVVYNTMEKTMRGSQKSITWILDNLTFLMKHNTNVQISSFLYRIKDLRQQMQVKGQYFTLIIVTHTNKKYNKEYTTPIKEEYIYGSAFLADFADSIIGIHRSKQDDTTDKHPYVQILKTRTTCEYDGFPTKRKSRPFASLKYAGSISPKKLFGGKNPQMDIDSSHAGVEFMYYYLYLECGMSPEEIGRLYHCSDTGIRKKFEKHIGKGYTDFPRREHNPEKGREYFEHRMEYICPPTKDEEGGERKDQ